MHSRSFNIFLSCALGVGIGSLIALELSAALWWVGLIVGGLVGYFSYEWKKVIAAVPWAWRVAVSRYRTARAWRPAPGGWTLIKADIPIFLILLSWGILFFPLLEVAAARGPDAPTNAAKLLLVTLLLLSLVFCGSVLLCGVTWFSLNVMTAMLAPEENIQQRLAQLHKEEMPTYAAVLRWNPVSVLVIIVATLLWAVVAGLVYALRGLVKVPSAMLARFRFLRTFSWQIFVRIHSQERLICGVDALLGAGIGYFAGSAIIGALAGGALGIINYELVTRRWLIPRGYVTLPAD